MPRKNSINDYFLPLPQLEAISTTFRAPILHTVREVSPDSPEASRSRTCSPNAAAIEIERVRIVYP